MEWNRPLGELNQLQRLLRRHSRSFVCASQRARDDGVSADLSYRLLLRDPERMDDLLHEVRAFQGTARVTGLAAQEESEL
ncbi:MAG: hypothetical protein LR015_01335 [Verrucomicrobia bacterium]|nr:hypothetical protein [Verrucomicrobiota bacterium]